MKTRTTSYLKWKARYQTPHRFLRGARCTNVNTFVFLPLLAWRLFGEEGSELAFVIAKIFKL